MSLSDLVASMASMASRGNDRLGSTSTVKNQVETIQTSIDNCKQILQSQRKQHSQIQLSIKKLEQQSKTSFQQVHKQISERVNYLTDLFKSDSRNQTKQFQYLELQNSKLHQQHDRLNQLSGVVNGRTQSAEDNVGL